MITTYFNPADIVYACERIRAHGEEPILYISQENAARLVEFVPFTLKSSKQPIIVEDEYNKGFIGKYKGALVYVTEEVGDLYVIVPRYTEEKKE